MPKKPSVKNAVSLQIHGIDEYIAALCATMGTNPLIYWKEKRKHGLY